MQLRNRRLDVGNVDGNISDDQEGEGEDTVALIEQDQEEENNPGNS